MTRSVVILLGALLSVASLPAAEKPLILVSNYPLQWVVETLVGDQAEVINLTKDAENPREWVPDDAALTLLEAADLVVLQGGGYETWVGREKLPNSFDSTRAIFKTYFQARKMDEQDQELFYLQVQGRAWLDPLHLEMQAAAIAAALEGTLGKEPLQKNLQTVRGELAELVKKLASSERLNRERILTLEPTLALTLNVAMNWLMFVPDFEDIQPGGIPPPNQEVFKKVNRAFLDFPFRMAVTLGEPPAGWEENLQRKWGVWTCQFNPGDRPSTRHASYPALMNSNFKHLTSGYIR